MSDIAEEECTNVNENGNSMIDQLFVLGGESQDPNDHSGGPLNDVWTTLGNRFSTYYAGVKRNEFGEPEIRRLSEMKWLNILFSDTVLSEEQYFEKMACVIQETDMQPPEPCRSTLQQINARWLPRYNHGAVVMNVNNDQTIFVIGGMSHLSIDLPIGWERMHGGIAPPRGKSLRYPGVAMNDVWTSTNGKVWELVTPGCLPHVHQRDITSETDGFGLRQAACTTDSDCYMHSTCDVSLGTCVCNMFSPRENFATAVFRMVREGDDGAPIFQDYIFVTGGFTYVSQNKCGEHACIGGYRRALNDVWHSVDGKVWETEPYGTLNAGWSPRGGHGIVVMRSSMWIAGGQGANVRNSSDHELYNDLWIFGQATDYVWSESEIHRPRWSPRANFAIVKGGKNIEEAYIIAGETENGVTNEVWRWHEQSNSWIRDYEATNQTVFDESHYISPYDHVSKMDPGKYWSNVPTERQLTPLSVDQIEKLRLANISRIVDLVDISEDQYVELLHVDRLNFSSFCRYRDFAKRVAEKCEPRSFYVDTDDLEEVDKLALFYGIIERVGQDRIIEYAMDQKAKLDSVPTDFCSDIYAYDDWYLHPDESEAWEQLLANIGDRSTFQGPVPVTCKSIFRPLAYAAGILYQSRVYLIGGHALPSGTDAETADTSVFSNNVWYRDGVHPKVLVYKNPPQSGSGDTYFEFMAQDDTQIGSTDLAAGLERELIFEYQLWRMGDGNYWSLVRHWTETRETLNVGNLLDGSGKYKIQVRAKDLAGHIDNPWSPQQLQYEYVWEYDPPLPMGLILGVTIAFIAIGILSFLGYRYYKRRQALKRFALKRMRRKFKRIQRERIKKDKKKGKKSAKSSRKKKMQAYLDEAKRREKEKKRSSSKSPKHKKRGKKSKSKSPKRKKKKKKKARA